MATTLSYDNALQLFRDRNYKEAIRSFEGVLTSGVEQTLADNCRYWIGECYYGLRQYREAITQFKAVLELQRTGKKAEAQFMIGNCYLALGDKGSARDAFEKVMSEYPVSPLAARAKSKLARLALSNEIDSATRNVHDTTTPRQRAYLTGRFVVAPT